MTHYQRLKKKRLGDLLVDEGLVGNDTVIAALHERQVSHRLLSEILIEAEELSEYDLARILVEQLQLPYLDLSTYQIHKDLVQTFDLSGPNVFGMVEQYYGRPRWYGVSLSVNW